MHFAPRRVLAFTIAFTLGTGGVALAQQKCPAVEPGPLPLKYRGGATVAAITPCDLMTRLYIYSDDSMLGRRVGTADNLRATAYLEREVRRLGLQPAGDSGGYFQYLPVFERRVDSSSTIAVAGQQFRFGADFTAAAQAARSLPETPAVFGGTANDTTNLLAADAVRGKLLVLRAAPGGGFGRGRGGPPSPALQAYQQMTAAAAAVVLITAPPAPAGRAPGGGGFTPRGGPSGAFEDPAQPGRGGFGGAGTLATIQDRVAQAIFGVPVDQLAKGAEGKPVAVDLKVVRSPLATRNVVAVYPGSDPKLRSQYVAIGAHSDHVGYTMGAAGEHDSLKAYDIVALTAGGDTRPRPVPTDQQWARINALKDSLRQVYPARPDSIANGADDDGSGSVSVLEIAEAFAAGKLKTKRSMVFVWHTGEEAGLWGSQWFSNHPSVPRDSIVAQLNLDMVGRGEASDVTGKNKEGTELRGAANYVQLVGSRRLSTELGDFAESVNRKQPVPFAFDYAMDADGHPQRIYCRSDHYNYARYGIPIIFFTTGGHADYHQNTDEAQYIQYRHMAAVDQLVLAIAREVADLDHRVVVDKAKPANPFASCVQ